MDEVVCALFGAERGNQFADPAAEMWNGSLGGLAQQRLQFAERLLANISADKAVWRGQLRWPSAQRSPYGPGGCR